MTFKDLVASVIAIAIAFTSFFAILYYKDKRHAEIAQILATQQLKDRECAAKCGTADIVTWGGRCGCINWKE